MRGSSAARKPRRTSPPKDSDLSQRVAKLTLEVQGIKSLVKRTHVLLQRVLQESALRPLTLADFDLDDEDQRQRYESQVLQRAGVHLAREMKTLRELGIVDEKGRLIEPKELPADMREGSTCDV